MQMPDVIHSWPCHTFLVDCSDWLSLIPHEWGFLIGLQTVIVEEIGVVT